MRCIDKLFHGMNALDMEGPRKHKACVCIDAEC